MIDVWFVADFLIYYNPKGCVFMNPSFLAVPVC